MKKYALTVLCMVVLAVGLSAQKLPKSVKKAKKEMNAGNLTEALKLVDTALEDGTTASIAEAWSVKGDILNAIAAKDSDALILAQAQGKTHAIANPEAGLKAFTAYEKALSASTGKKDKGQKAALKGLSGLSNNINNVATSLFQDKKFAQSYELFSTLIKARALANKFGNKSILPKAADFNTIQYYTGIAAAYAGTPEKATDIYKALVDANYNESLPYEQLFESLIKTDEKAAFEVLNKGKKACSDDPTKLKGFLYKEINHYLSKGQTDVLETKLQEAIAQEPDNHTLHFVLGNVYSDLASKATGANKDNYTKQAEKYYRSTLEVKPDFSDANAGIGLIYFNKATTLNDPIKKLSEDYSSAGSAKYEALKKEQLGLLEQSVPFFEKTLKGNPKHLQSLEALKAVAAYKNDFEAVKKYKALIEAATR